jgi:GH24 family phage-related lysozyme (muramidase)
MKTFACKEHPMNLEQLQKELAVDEGCKLEIYLDHLGYPTVGIGHLITEDDELYGFEVGSEVSQEHVDDLFHADVQRTLRDCEFLYSDFNDLPEEAQLIIANMCFQLGRPRLSGFKKMKAAVDSRDWREASRQMLDSKWAKQTPNRASRLSHRMAALGDT